MSLPHIYKKSIWSTNGGPSSYSFPVWEQPVLLRPSKTWHLGGHLNFLDHFPWPEAWLSVCPWWFSVSWSRSRRIYWKPAFYLWGRGKVCVHSTFPRFHFTGLYWICCYCCSLFWKEIYTHTHIYIYIHTFDIPNSTM